VLGPFLAPLVDAWPRVRLRLRVAPLDPAFLAYLVVAAPLMFGQTLLTVDEWYGRWFGALLATGTVAHLAFARRLMLVPVAVVGQAIAAAALPTLSRLWAERRQRELDRVVSETLRIGTALAILAAGAFVALAHPIVRFIYQRGAFTPDDTRQVAVLVSILAFAVPAWITQQIAARAFYARGDTWRPMVLGTLVAIAAIPVYLALGKRFGAPGLGVAGVLGMTANAAATLALARLLHGAPRLGPLAGTAVRAAAISAVALAAARVAGGAPEATLAGAARQLTLGGGAFLAAASLGIAVAGGRSLRSGLWSAVRRGAWGR